jgi:NRAMP (natural resistance-associated macrophage protein)-like metal ion transporter
MQRRTQRHAPFKMIHERLTRGRRRRAREPGEHSHNPLVRYFRVLGPGLVTGASDDDPSGIATYAVAGATLGTSLLWTAGATFPLMTAIQLICARIGLVSGVGLMAAVRGRYRYGFLQIACLLLLVANTFNIAADLAGMGDAVEMLLGLPPHLVIPVIGVVILMTTIYCRYTTFAQYLKWLTVALFAYIVTAFLAAPDWTQVLRATVVPTVHWNREWLMAFVGILGTTISPYLFFWQASHEVEEKKAHGFVTLRERQGATAHELRDARLDVGVGMLFSNLVMYFIILTTAATLHRAHVGGIETTRQAAEALRPLAGDGAYLLFTIGILGTGLLAIPVLMGSASFAVAELYRWRAGLDHSFSRAPRFYLIMVLALSGGLALDLLHLNPIRMLFWSAVLNGLLAPPLMVLVMLVGNNREIMGAHVNGPWLNALGWTATALMSLAALAFLVSSL